MDIFESRKDMIRFIDITQEEENDLQDSPKVVSLFSGSGGLDLGLEWAGFNTAVCIDIDPDCRETLRFNRPGWKLFESDDNQIAGDIREIESDELLDFAALDSEEVSLVVGGAPCQPFSNIGKRQGRKDSVNGDLFLEFVRIVKGILPKAFLFENVTGITQKKHQDVVDYMVGQFQGLGYGISYTTLNAADYGVSQKRKRFFMIGIKGLDKPAFPLPTHFESEISWEKFVGKLSSTPNSTPKAWITLRQVLTKIPDNSHSRADYALMNCSEVVKERMKYIKPGENFHVLPYELRPPCWRTGKHQGQDTFGRLVLDRPSVTIRTAAYNPMKGRYIHPTEDRGLSTHEMAAIQGFPYSWEFKCHNRKKVTLVSAGRQIGNAVPPSLAKALGLAIKVHRSPCSPKLSDRRTHKTV